MSTNQDSLQPENAPKLEEFGKLVDAGKTEEAKALLEKLLLEAVDKTTDSGLILLAKAYFETRNEQLKAYAALLRENAAQIEALDEASKDIAETKEVIEIRKSLE